MITSYMYYNEPFITQSLLIIIYNILYPVYCHGNMQEIKLHKSHLNVDNIGGIILIYKLSNQYEVHVYT